MKRIAGKQKFWAVLGAGLLMAAASGSALARQIEDRDVLPWVVQQEQKSTTAASPLPAPVPADGAEFTGVVEVIASDSWVVSGQTVAVSAATEIKSGVEIGALVKVHVARQADGSLWAREIEAASTSNPNSNSNDNGNSNMNSNDDNGNDDRGGSGNVNSNDDNDDDDPGGSGNVNSNDDDDVDDGGNGNVNSNDDNGDDGGSGNVNSNDDNGDDDRGGSSNVNSNDDNGNDDHGGQGTGG